MDKGDGRLRAADRARLSRELALLLPLLTVALVAVALVAASRRARHQDSDDDGTLHDLNAVSLEETGHLRRVDHVDPPQVTIKQLRFARTGVRYGLDARPRTQEASLTVPTRRSDQDAELSSQAGDGSARVLRGSSMTSSSKSSTRHRSASPARATDPEEEAVLVSVRALLSAMQATSTSPVGSSIPDLGNLTTEDAVEDEEIGDDESTERLKEDVPLQDEEDFRKTHEEPGVDRQRRRIARPSRLPSRH
ncbi:uncharacterized protein LOC144123446 [Amblyomma americanum]